MPKGFHNVNFYDKNGELVNRKGHKREDIYGALEYRAMQLFNGFIENNKVIHEKPIKVKTTKGSKTVTIHFWCDFYDPFHKLDIEIDPSFHKRFKKVANRDLRRTRLLKEKHGIETMRLTEIHLNYDTIPQIIQQINALKISPEILDYYF